MAFKFRRPVLRERLARLAGDESGQVAILFGLSLVPLTFMVGAALDYSGASNLRAHLQAATDGTNLKLCQIPGNPNKKTLEDEAAKLLTSYMGSAAYKIDDLNANSNPRQIELTTSADFSTAILKAFGYPKVPVGARAKCTLGEPQTYEIALVLDTTGSMATAHDGVSKIQSLRTAAKEFVDYVFDDSKMSTSTKISIVPFAASVAVSPNTYRNASWVDTGGKASYHWSWIKDGKAAAAAAGVSSRLDVYNHLKATQAAWDWKGCFESLPFPLNTQDVAPTPSNPDSYYVPMFAPDESGAGGELYHQDASGNWVLSANSYIDDWNSVGGCGSTTDETQRTNRACKYMELKNAKTTNGAIATGPNFSCTSRPLTRMTTNKATLLSEISQLNAEGNTDVHEGFMWGWRTISKNSVFGSDADQYGKKNNNKVIVLMTDGMNTWSENGYNPTLKSYYSAYGHYRSPDGGTPNNRLPPANASPTNNGQARAAMDALTLEACKNAAAPANGVIIYTIGFSVPNDPIDKAGLDMLKACAGNSSRFFVAGSGTDLVTIFKKIGQDIGGLRLTN